MGHLPDERCLFHCKVFPAAVGNIRIKIGVLLGVCLGLFAGSLCRGVSELSLGLVGRVLRLVGKVPGTVEIKGLR